LKGQTRACWLAVEPIQRLDPCHLWVSPQLHLPIAAASLILQQFLTKQQLPSVQDSEGCTGKERALHTPGIFHRFALLFHLTGRSTEDKTGSVRFRSFIFFFSFFNVLRHKRISGCEIQTLLFQVSLLIIMIKRH